MKKTPFPRPSHKKKTQRSSRGERLLIIIMFIVVILGWTFRQDLIALINTSVVETGGQDNNRFSMGDEINLSGNLVKNENTNYPYTHNIEDTSQETFGLRSSSINLYALSGEVSLVGKIVDYINNLYVLEVIEASDKTLENQDDLLYFSTPGVLVNNIAKKGFTITQSTAQETISIANPTNGDSINIRYFICGDDELVDCENYEQTLKKEGTITQDNYNTIYYTLEDRQSRFTNLDGRYGVIIEVSRHQLFPYVIENIEFITEKWANNTLLTSAKSSCKDDQYQLQTISDQSLGQSGDVFVWSLDGSDNETLINCEVVFDPSNLDASLTSSMEYEEDSTEEDEDETTDQTNEEDENETSSGNEIDSNESGDEDTSSGSIVTNDNKITNTSDEQFPLQKDKGLEFTSNQGDTIFFPSPNIYFEANNILEGPQGQSCFIQMNIVEFKNQEDIENPNVAIYFCDENINNIPHNFRTITREDDTILIEAIDPSWIDFANNISIS